MVLTMSCLKKEAVWLLVYVVFQKFSEELSLLLSRSTTYWRKPHCVHNLCMGLKTAAPPLFLAPLLAPVTAVFAISSTNVVFILIIVMFSG